MTDKQYRAYKYLSRLWRIKREIRDKEDELYSASLASGIRYDKDAVQVSPVDPMDKIAILISDIKEEREEYILLQHKMINQIHGLEDKISEQILADRFIKNRSIREIMRLYGYSKTQAYRQFCQALDSFSEKYGTKWDSG